MVEIKMSTYKFGHFGGGGFFKLIGLKASLKTQFVLKPEVTN